MLGRASNGADMVGRSRMGLGLAGAAAMATLAGAQSGSVVERIQPGQWQLSEAGATTGRSLCLTDPATVLQLGHGDARCTRNVIERSATALTVHYSCPGSGQGHTILTLRSPTSFRLQTQGLTGGMPFEYDYDARRTGDCAGTH